MALIDTQLRNTKPSEKDHTVTDGLGLIYPDNKKGGRRCAKSFLGNQKLNER